MTDQNFNTPSKNVDMEHSTLKPFEYTRPDRESSDGNNIVLVNKIIREVTDWANQFKYAEDATKLCKAMDDLSWLMTICWTEVDESLIRLILAENSITKENNIETPLMYLGHAKGMLNRWQGRGGRVGNVSPL